MHANGQAQKQGASAKLPSCRRENTLIYCPSVDGMVGRAGVADGAVPYKFDYYFRFLSFPL
jgi:hypothetical protein